MQEGSMSCQYESETQPNFHLEQALESLNQYSGPYEDFINPIRMQLQMLLECSAQFSDEDSQMHDSDDYEWLERKMFDSEGEYKLLGNGMKYHLTTVVLPESPEKHEQHIMTKSVESISLKIPVQNPDDESTDRSLFDVEGVTKPK